MFKHIGVGVKLSPRAMVYGEERIVLEDYCRIDDFCVLSAGDGGIRIGRFVHVACMSRLIGRGRIVLHHFSAVSAGCSIYSSSDDYSGDWMTNPTIPAEYTNATHADVFIGKHAIIGTGSVILPGVVVGEGCAVGALSLVKRSLDPFFIYAGVPVRKIGKRETRFLRLERQLLSKGK